ncbi:M15 family metallopeptidase [Hymenobacter fodinae]|uniref:M15 family peptidase n=1 Tax=Hymenobacter fodinae TaxID=2510796 RepID=A0A4Z0P2R3_9BACT|nr:M15 family metallopeptidase [Hymenobacter fodinae]TGE05541.1 M15 family peptidase [Hymenobacter fodinae]
MADINQLHSLLQHAYTEAKAQFIKDNPTLPKPLLSFTYRSPAVQNAFYAQGREPLAKVNALRKPLNLYLLGPVEGKRKVTNAKGGQSPHNYLPAMAFDVAFDKGNGVLDWSESLFKKFAAYVLRYPGITWGGNFHSFKDLPHFEVTGWASKVKKVS